MATGIVKWFNDAKGFGFIEPDSGGGDIFAHFSSIAMDGFKTLKQGARVRFEVVDGPKGRLAQNIRAEPGDEAGGGDIDPERLTPAPYDAEGARHRARRTFQDRSESADARNAGPRSTRGPRVRAPQFQANHPRGA